MPAQSLPPAGNGRSRGLLPPPQRHPAAARHAKYHAPPPWQCAVFQGV